MREQSESADCDFIASWSIDNMIDGEVGDSTDTERAEIMGNVGLDPRSSVGMFGCIIPNLSLFPSVLRGI